MAYTAFWNLKNQNGGGRKQNVSVNPKRPCKERIHQELLEKQRVNTQSKAKSKGQRLRLMVGEKESGVRRNYKIPYSSVKI